MNIYLQFSSTFSNDRIDYAQKNVQLNFLTQDGKGRSIKAQPIHPNSVNQLFAFIQWLKDFFIRKIKEFHLDRANASGTHPAFIHIKLNKDSPSLSIKVDALKRILTQRELQKLKSGDAAYFLRSQEQRRLRMKRTTEKIEAFAHKKGIVLTPQDQAHILNLLRKKGFNDLGEIKAFIKRLVIQEKMRAKERTQAKIKQLFVGIPVKQGTVPAKAEARTPLDHEEKLPTFKVETEADKMIHFASSLGFDKQEIKDLKRLSAKVSFTSLNKTLDNIETVEDKKIMLRTFIRIGKELKVKFSLFKKESRYFNRVEQNNQRLTHAFAFNKKDIFAVPQNELLGKGSFKNVSEAIKLTDLSTDFVRVKVEAKGENLLEATQTIRAVEIEEKFLEKLHRYGKLYNKKGYSCLAPPYECRILSKSNDSSKLILFQQRLENGEKLKEASVTQQLYALRDGAEGLAYLHDLNYVHMDVKIANLLLDGKIESQTPIKGKVGDFGMTTKKGTLIKGGSIAFLPGEAIESVPAPKIATFKSGCKADPKIDSFSFGVTIFNVVTGYLPKIFGFLEQEEIDQIIKIEKQRIWQSNEPKKDKELKFKMLNIALQLMQQKAENRISCHSAAEKLNTLISLIA